MPEKEGSGLFVGSDPNQGIEGQQASPVSPQNTKHGPRDWTDDTHGHLSDARVAGRAQDPTLAVEIEVLHTSH